MSFILKFWVPNGTRCVLEATLKFALWLYADRITRWHPPSFLFQNFSDRPPLMAVIQCLVFVYFQVVEQRGSLATDTPSQVCENNQKVSESLSLAHARLSEHEVTACDSPVATCPSSTFSLLADNGALGYNFNYRRPLAPFRARIRTQYKLCGRFSRRHRFIDLIRLAQATQCTASEPRSRR